MIISMKELTVTFSEAVVEDKMGQIAPIEKFNPFEITFRVERGKLTTIIATLLQNFNMADISTAEVDLAEAIADIFHQTMDA